MTPPIVARRRALRALLSALAGSGLTAATLGGPLAADAGAAGSEGTTTSASAVPEAPASTTTQPTTTSATAVPEPTTSTPASTTTAPSAPAPEAPKVVLQRKQRTSQAAPANPSQTSTEETKNGKKAAGESNVAGSPESIAQANALAAVLASSQASVQALDFYRIPLFLLPVYKAAAVQYGVPWQILAAVNEIETNYGTDLSVSSAGAVGWMQFMPATWLQYGVDALNAGYADPYNPVDAIFAAARYLRAAGAATNLRGAILAYNHSEEYASSVLLRAKLISTYPKDVIATLTGIVDGRVPVTGHQLAWQELAPELLPAPQASKPATTGHSSATAGASPASGHGGTASARSAASTQAATPGAAPTTPGAQPAVSPGEAAAGAALGGTPQAPIQQFVELTTAPGASVVAVQDGRVKQIGQSRKLGKFIVLQDVYGDVFTYAGLGSVAPTYTEQKLGSYRGSSPAVTAASTHDPAPSLPASAGSQPLTLQVKVPAPAKARAHAKSGQISIPSAEDVPAGMSKVRLYAHPNNPDARAAAAVTAARDAARNAAARRQPLRKGSVVASGTVLGKVATPHGSHAGHMRFAIRPTGDTSTIEAGPILANWGQLQKALDPEGAHAADALLGATASDVFLLSRAQLERAVLSDPGITIEQSCARQDVASGVVDQRVLALLAFLSRSGLQPTVSALRCGQSQYSASGAPSASYRGDAVAITAINDIPVARHQGPGTITDLTIRTLLTMPSQFVPHEVTSLMRYPGSANTHADPGYWNRVYIAFLPPSKPATALAAGSAARAAHSAGAGATAPAPRVSTSALTPAEWTQLIARIGALPVPKVPVKPTSSAIPDGKPKKSG